MAVAVADAEAAVVAVVVGVSVAVNDAVGVAKPTVAVATDVVEPVGVAVGD